MDQVRAIAKVIWEQRFWVLSVIGLIVAVVCWNMAAGKLDTEFGTRALAIKGQFDAMTGITSKPVLPNQEVNAENQKQVDEQKKIVDAVWKQLFDRQKEAVLKWPKELGPQFVEGMADKKFRDPIDINLRSIYQNYISNRFDGLLAIVDAKKLGDGMGGGGYSRGGEMDGGGRGGDPYSEAGAAGAFVVEDHLVQWLDQDKLRARLSFATSKPSALQIWITQEDLWVYEALLKVIANTNKARGATRPDNTAIHTIFALEVGASAALGPGANKGHVYLPSGAMAGGMGVGGYEGDAGGRGMAMDGGGAPPVNYEMDGGGGRGMGMDGAAVDPAAADSVLLTSRYLDDTGAPLPGEGDLGKEYRQLPIRMDLFMDQRWLPHLLIECANSPLPIEVKQVRINPEKSMTGFGTNSGGSQSMVQGAGPLPTDPNFAQVEIKGVVFIYNEPTTDPNAAPVVDPATQTAAQ